MNWLKRRYYDLVSTLAFYIAKACGPVHAPWTKKRLDYSVVEEMLQVLQPGDILLTRTHGELTTIAIPGFYKHTAIYMGAGRIIEAISPKAKIGYLANLVLRTDNIAARRMNNITDEEVKLLSAKAKSYVDKETLYDYHMRFLDESSVSCSELGFNCINFARPNYLELWYRMGYPSFTPQDFYYADSKFSTVFEERDI